MSPPALGLRLWSARFAYLPRSALKPIRTFHTIRPLLALPQDSKGIRHDESPPAVSPIFRLKEEPGWGEGESALSKAGRTFLMMEMARGMYVVLEQFFKPP
jgi:hypothetical protein